MSVKGIGELCFCPRSVLKAKVLATRLLTWAQVNLIFALGVTPTLWMRECSPIRKKGSGMVRNPEVLRPISYVDDLEGIFDAVWLKLCRPRLEEYMGVLQAGGQFDHGMVVLAVLMAIQARTQQGLPSLLQVADLRQGYELTWRDAVRVHLRRAGLTGRLWLVADASLRAGNMRIRL